MFKAINKMLSWITTYAILAGIATLIYDNLLIDLFKVDITLFQWLGIIIISACIFPNPDKMKVTSIFEDKQPINPFKRDKQDERK